MMDLKAGQYQVEFDDKDREKAVRKPDDLYGFKVIPFGLRSTPATWERKMKTILRGFKYNIYLSLLSRGYNRVRT
ncbi:hypothetical protein X975_22450, partial [Stegodyphus mimosarum]